MSGPPTSAAGRPFACGRLAVAVLAAGAVVLLACQARDWPSDLGSLDRPLAAAVAGWLLLRRPGPAAPVSAWAGQFGVGLAVLGAALAPPAVYLHVRAGQRPTLVWWEAGCLLLAAAGVSLTRGGWPRLRAAVTPALLALTVLPLPGTVAVPLRAELQRVAAAAADQVLTPAGQKTGRTDRAGQVWYLTALPAAALATACRRRLGPARTAALVLLSVPAVAGANAVRLVLAGRVGEPPDLVAGAALLCGLAGLLGLARLLGRPGRPPDAPARGRPAHTRAVAAAVALGGLGCAAAGAAGAWVATHAAATAPPLESLPLDLGRWRGGVRTVEPAVTDILMPDRVVHRQYVSPTGQAALVWVFYWSAGGLVRGYHHPDICLPAGGREPVERRRVEVSAGGRPLSVECGEYAKPRDHRVVLSWVQDGRHVWAEADEAAEAARSLGGVRRAGGWALDLLSPGRPDGGPRLRVVVEVFGRGRAAWADAAGLAGLLAAEVYRLCPWAAPE